MNRKKKSTPGTNDFELARNDLFSHIHRCGVLRATEEQQVEWMNDTVEYLAECHPSLSEEGLAELKEIGLRFCRPVIAHGVESTAPVQETDEVEEPVVEEATAA